MGFIKLAEHEVIKHTAAIHISNALSLLQRKVSNVLLKNAYERLMDKHRHAIKVSELMRAVGFDSKDEELVKDALRTLNKTQIEWNILGKDKTKTWIATTVLAWVKIEKGVCEYEYSMGLREMLLNPNIYARIDLLVQREIGSKHVLALWEYFMGELALVQSNRCFTPWIAIDELQKLLGIQKEYNEFKFFNFHVIKKSVTEINRLNLKIHNVEYKRKKRRVVALRFDVSKNTTFQPTLNLDFPTLPSGEKETLIKSDNGLLQRLLGFGLTAKKAEKALATHDRQYISDNLDIVEKNCRAGNVANVPAYAMTALKEDFRPKETFVEKEKKAKQAETKTRIEQAQKKEIIERLKAEFEAAQLEAAIKELPEKEFNTLKGEFLAAKKSEKGGDFILGYYHKHGFDHIVVKGVFLAFAKERLLKKVADIQKFRAYIEEKGYKAKKFEDEIRLLMK